MILGPTVVRELFLQHALPPIPTEDPTILGDTPAESNSLSLDATSPSLTGELLNFS